MKNLKKLFSLTLVLMLVWAGSASAASITVTGSATLSAASDQAVVYLGAQELHEDVITAQSNVNQRINAILSALESHEELALSPEDITTESYNINTRYDYNPETGEEYLSGYSASCMLAIVVRNIDQVGLVIDVAFDAGANNMNYIDFQLADSAEVNDQVLTLALENALHKAQLLAKTAGIDLSECELSIQEGGSYYSESIVRATYDSANSASGKTSIRGGELTFSASVSVTYTQPDKE